ncbi:hypothetical protein HU200_051459 [Digitaria exilis]|uniref:Peptidase A1 domain-containing protein n=1 Tax=Digitaria exilis TaxID=1010633 RepID=A0A835AQ35_9POAL|nr:hypothetical protein HU200_051459 [Digitaria exilis]
MLASGAAGVRVELTRLHSSRFVRDAVRRDMHRHSARRLAASSGDTVSAPVSKDTARGEYLMMLAIGTPPLSYPAIADTGSDLIWTQCAPCTDQCFPQPTPLYNPASSTTFSYLPCSSPLSICEAASLPACVCPGYNYTYGTGWTSGVQGSETFTFGSSPADETSVSDIVFGCSNASSSTYFNGSSGLVGLGRGSLSLVSQLSAGKFSYCLTPFQDTSSSSTLLLGSSASLNDAGVGSTPFVANPTTAPTFYYLDLTGISLGTTDLSIPADAFSLKADGTGGLIIDSGSTITSLVDVAYQQVRAAVLSLVTLPTADGSAATGLDLNENGDTGSDLIWTQCAPCSAQCFQQPTPLYNPASSTTFSPVTCDTTPSKLCPYNQTYGIGWTAGILGSETFTFGSSAADQTRVPGLTFGCSNASSNDSTGSSGLVGLGRGSLSLVTQLGADKFSYCLTPFQDTNSTSTLLLGPSASLNGRGVGSTPFVTSPAQALTHYYVNLTGISLGTTALSIPADAFSLNDTDGTGGLIIDSGTTVTYLVDAAYQQVRAAVLSLVTTLPTTDASAETGLDLCFALPSSTSAPPAMPSMTLHFDGADMYCTEEEDDMDRSDEEEDNCGR